MHPIATINAVKNGEFYCTIRRESRGTDLQGAYCVLDLNGGNNRQRVLARINSVDMTNPVHENPLYAPVLMVRGTIPHFSGDADVESTTLDTIAVIDSETEQYAPRRSNPCSGTPVESIDADGLHAFLREKTLNAIVGSLPNNPAIPVSIRNRHFGDYQQGGEGEARHSLYAGKNGSGKTVQVLVNTAAKLCAHPAMGLFCPDTAGDISARGRHHRGDFRFDFYDLLDRAGRAYDIVDIAELKLKDTLTLKRLLALLIAEHMGLHQDKAALLADRTTEYLFDGEVDASRLTADNVLEAIIENIESCYAKNSRKEKREDAENLASSPGRKRPFERELKSRIVKFFIGKKPLEKLLSRFLNEGHIVILKMDSLTPNEQQFVMAEVFKNMRWMAESRFKKGGAVNALVLLDEGPRWIRQGDDSAIGCMIRDAFNTTRKYGLGWTVITQRLADIDKTVIAQAHTRYFGRGLGVGVDLIHLQESLGKNGVATYRHLELQGGYFWLGVGMDANIGTESTFFAFRAFDGDATESLIQANPHIWRPTL